MFVADSDPVCRFVFLLMRIDAVDFDLSPHEIGFFDGVRQRPPAFSPLEDGLDEHGVVSGANIDLILFGNRLLEFSFDCI